MRHIRNTSAIRNAIFCRMYAQLRQTDKPVLPQSGRSGRTIRAVADLTERRIETSPLPQVLFINPSFTQRAPLIIKAHHRKAYQYRALE